MIKVVGLLSALFSSPPPTGRKPPQVIKISTRARPSGSLLASPLVADLTFMRTIARHMPKHLPGNPSMIVDNMTRRADWPRLSLQS